MANKRWFSSQEHGHPDKRACIGTESIQRLVGESVVCQMKYIERLVFKDTECQALKRKHQEVDNRCRRWHEFAVGLQSRVKRLEVILHKQQEAIKKMKLEKRVETADASIQTDPLPLLPEFKKSKLMSKKKFIEVKKDSGSVDLKHKPPLSDVIDLTDDD